MTSVHLQPCKTPDALLCIGRFVFRSSCRAAPSGPCDAGIRNQESGAVEFLKLPLGGVKRHRFRGPSRTPCALPPCCQPRRGSRPESPMGWRRRGGGGFGVQKWAKAPSMSSFCAQAVAHQVVEGRHVGPALHAALDHLDGLVGVVSNQNAGPCDEQGVVWAVHQALPAAAMRSSPLSPIASMVYLAASHLRPRARWRCCRRRGSRPRFRGPRGLNHLGEVGEGELVVRGQGAVGVQRSFGEVVAHDGAVHVPVLAAGLVALGAWHQH